MNTPLPTPRLFANLLRLFCAANLLLPAMAATEPPPSKPLPGRFVRVESGTSMEELHFSELEVYANHQNIALRKPTQASSTLGDFKPEMAVDGLVEYAWGAKDMSFWTSTGKGDQWWEVDLGKEQPIDRIVFWNRFDCCRERLAGAVLVVLDQHRKPVFQQPLDAVAMPNEIVFFDRPPLPVDVTSVPLEKRISDLGPGFDQPSEDPAMVMPVGSGDLSAMVRFGDALHLHLSKSDFASLGNTHDGYNGNLHSPGHVRLSFDGVNAAAITRFSQKLDFTRGSIRIALATADGDLDIEVFGVMGSNTIIADVADRRKTKRGVSAEYSIWRPAMRVSSAAGKIVTSEVHDFDRQGRKVDNPAGVPADDLMYGLGNGSVISFAGDSGNLPATESSGGDDSNRTATLAMTVAPKRYQLVISSECTYDGSPEKNAEATHATVITTAKQALRDRQLDWWKRHWQASYVDLHGKDAERLTRLWFTTYYSYACVGSGPILPKFNGGPGLIDRDSRSWGISYWWQNTRELIWPMYAGNHLDAARNHLDFYDRYFTRYQQATAGQGKLGIEVPEGADPLKPGIASPPRQRSVFSIDALNQAVANRTRENGGTHFTSHIFVQGAELVQQMFDYAAFSGDESYLREVTAPWLHEVVLFYLSYLKPGDDGLYHFEPANAVETWWKVRDPATMTVALRYCFWHTLNHGERFGYSADFLATVRDRLEKLAPIPTGIWKVRNFRPEERPANANPWDQTIIDAIEPSDAHYAPAANILDEKLRRNMENPELYIIYPFALVDANAPKADFDRAVLTFQARAYPNTAGWSQCGIQAARLRLPDTADIIADHMRRHQKFPYGGWDNVGNPLAGSKLQLMDVPNFDTACVQLTALQETLLQSHNLSTPAATAPLTGGPIRILPAVRKDWAGRFQLRARGGFLVRAVFQPRHRVEQLAIVSERGNELVLENPFRKCRVSLGGKVVLTTSDSLVRLPTRKGDVLTFTEAGTP